MPRRGSSKPPAEPVVKPYGCDFLDKLIERGRCEFGKIRVAFHKLDKLVCFQLVGYLARGVALIQLFHKPVQLLAPLPCLVDFLLALLGRNRQ